MILVGRFGTLVNREAVLLVHLFVPIFLNFLHELKVGIVVMINNVHIKAVFVPAGVIFLFVLFYYNAMVIWSSVMALYRYHGLINSGCPRATDALSVIQIEVLRLLLLCLKQLSWVLGGKNILICFISLVSRRVFL